MSTGVNCGQVRGPIQFSFARSVDQIVAAEHAITRCAVTTKAESNDQDGGNRTMGRKFTIPYALYRCSGFVNPHLASQTGFSEDDLQLFWKALENMFDTDRSAARGQMAARKLVVFKHKDALGNAPAHRLLDRVKVGSYTGDKPARSFEDYAPLISIDRQDLPEGIEIIEAF